MPKAIFQDIYQELKREIDSGTYPYQSFLPSESGLTRRFGCSRSSIRRAIAQLAAAGYVQPLQGKGVRVIRNPRTEGLRGMGGLETFNELSRRRGFTPRTETIVFETIRADEKLANLTGFLKGSELTHIVRVRYADGSAVGTDESYYLSGSVSGLTPQIVDRSVYDYLEQDLGISIVTSKRTITVEPIGERDREVIELQGFNAIAVMRCNAYDTNGIMVEYTETRQRPGFFELDITSLRQHG